MSVLRNLEIALLAVIVGVGVAFTYYLFEKAVRVSTPQVWYAWLQTDTHRLLVIPACLVLGMVYFGLQKILDPTPEEQKPEGLGRVPSPTVINFLKVLLIGYSSLIAGASLGPEAVLVPACVVLGGYIGMKFFSDDGGIAKLLGGAGLVALFAAFFNSFVVGLLSVFMLSKKLKTKLSVRTVIVATIASGSTILVLDHLEAKSYVTTPQYSWHINVATIILFFVLLITGYVGLLVLAFFERLFLRFQSNISEKRWWVQGLVAAFGLAVLYILGGHLIEFTGNESIVPLFQQASSIGLVGLLWIFVAKLAAMAWSKSLNYRGGLIFPSVFAAAVLVAIAQLYIKDFNAIYGLIAVMVGMFAANRKADVLF